MKVKFPRLLSLTVCVCCFLVVELVTAGDDHVISKRSDDSDPLEAVVNRLSQSLTELQARMTASEAAHSQENAQLQARIVTLESAHNKQVAFLANVAADLGTANTPLPLTAVFNIGNGFDSGQHIFVAPYAGIYLFTYQVFYRDIGQQLLVDLMRNVVDIVLRMRAFDQVMEISTATAVVVQASAGDRFWLRPDHDARMYGGGHSFFSGVLLVAQ